MVTGDPPAGPIRRLVVAVEHHDIAALDGVLERRREDRVPAVWLPRARAHEGVLHPAALIARVDEGNERNKRDEADQQGGDPAGEPAHSPTWATSAWTEPASWRGATENSVLPSPPAA